MLEFGIGNRGPAIVLAASASRRGTEAAKRDKDNLRWQAGQAGRGDRGLRHPVDPCDLDGLAADAQTSGDMPACFTRCMTVNHFAM